MQSNQLKRIHPNKKRMVVARGGKRGKTAGRGGKGQSARAGNKRRPEWRDIIKRVPKLRGRGKSSNKPFQEKPIIVNLAKLEAVFSANDAITPTILVEKGLISTIFGRVPLVKILGDGELTKALKISGCYMSESAEEKINKAGGSIVPMVTKVTIENKPKTKEKTEAKVKSDDKDKKPKAEKKPEIKKEVKTENKTENKKVAKKKSE